MVFEVENDIIDSVVDLKEKRFFDYSYWQCEHNCDLIAIV